MRPYKMHFKSKFVRTNKRHYLLLVVNNCFHRYIPENDGIIAMKVNR
jgi:hypothetical protein